MTAAARSPLRRLERVRSDRLPDALRAEILAIGAGAVPELVAVIERGQSWAQVHAASLLADIGDPAAIEPLLRALCAADPQSLLHDPLTFAIESFGAAALEPLLAAHASAEDPELRADLLVSISKLGVRDERTFRLLMAALEEERATRTFGLAPANLAEYGDPRAFDALVSLLAELNPADDTLDEQIFFELEDAIETLGRPLTEAEAAKVAEARARRRARFAIRVQRAPASRAPRPGRNDPCWCQSGRKYKKCHLAADEAGRGAVAHDRA